MVWLYMKKILRRLPKKLLEVISEDSKAREHNI